MSDFNAPEQQQPALVNPAWTEQAAAAAAAEENRGKLVLTNGALLQRMDTATAGIFRKGIAGFVVGALIVAAGAGIVMFFSRKRSASEGRYRRGIR